MAVTGFVPPPYPHDRLAELRVTAEAVPGGIVDCSVGTPVDPMPELARRALADAAGAATGYPAAIGAPAYREAAAAWIGRRFGVSVGPGAVVACVGTKELVASLPRVLALRDPSRDTVLYPDIAYPTYEMGARLAGFRAVPVPVDERWLLDLSRVDEEDAARALLVWVNEPGNPTGSSGGAEHLRAVADWARSRGAIVASDECYAEFTFDDAGAPAPPATILAHGHDRALAVHSLSKRSNMAGLRAGFVAGDAALVSYVGEVRKHAGLMTPGPVQAAATAALGDDLHVDEQRACYARRRADALDALGAWGLVHDGGPSTFYLWLRSATQAEDGWSIARRLAERGLLVSPGGLYGPGGAAHVRLSLTQPDERLALACDRLTTKERV
ncbi:MAG TPA: succinyldiaminopimelate transaminase [Acidimicrobiia bacterium]|nr:succinyldiaminopimelate transaminase [Acidimicrobiia bacterium]